MRWDFVWSSLLYRGNAVMAGNSILSEFLKKDRERGGDVKDVRPKDEVISRM